jgi:hypothetical protein
MSSLSSNLSSFFIPSFMGLVTTGFLILIVLILLLKHFNKLGDKDRIVIFLLLSISVGIHSILHAYAEERLDWNPLENKWIPKKRYYNKC